ncbi:MAG: TrkH family potassium uptake protein [Porphyromonas sp.]|nr:TrkH family potassium uptake protein [Porphyromonas sp.]
MHLFDNIRRKVNYRFVTRMLGFLCLLEIPFLLVSLLVGLFYDSHTTWAFLTAIIIMASVGGALLVIGRDAKHYKSGRKEAMLTVSLAWITLSLIGMTPYIISGYIPNPADAFFETMSGFTTTGATILDNVEALPKSLLLWRSITQWQGGIGIVVFALALLPIFGGSGSLVYNYEASGVLHEKFMPRAGIMAKKVTNIYLMLTLACCLLFWLGPMDLFDSICHALTCVCSGGFSTRTSSLAYYNSSYTDIVAMIFMFLAATNFALIYFAMTGKPKKLLQDTEFRWFFTIVIIAGLSASIWIYVKGLIDAPLDALRHGFFQVISLISTTGYYTQDYDNWLSFFALLALCIMFVAGCTGSTSGGLKTGRFLILVKNLLNEIRKRTHPNAILPVKADNIVIPTRFVSQVSIFFFAYAMLILLCILFLTIEGIKLDSAVPVAVSCVSNSGPALVSFGPTESYAALGSVSKIVMSLMMMIGRLEIFTVLAVFHGGFWRD